MRKLRKWLAAGLSMTMALALVACGSGSKNDTKSNAGGSAVKQASTQSKTSSAGAESKTSTLEPVTLKMYFLGEPQSDNDMVFEEINMLRLSLITYLGEIISRDIHFYSHQVKTLI